jgi:hypothetical protein
MRSNYIRAGGAEQRQMFREIAKDEIKKQKADFCPGCEEKIQTQVIALLCRVLHDRFGFGKKRLTELLQLARGLDIITVDAKKEDQIWVDWLREKMGIVLVQPKKKE